MELSLSSLKSKAKQYNLALNAGGFFLGVTAKDAKGKANYNLVWRATDFLGRLGVGGVSLTDPGSGTTYTSVAKLAFNPFGFINAGLGAFIALSAADALIDGPEIDFVAAIGKPIALGYAIGGFLDPPNGGASYVGTPQSQQSLPYSNVMTQGARAASGWS